VASDTRERLIRTTGRLLRTQGYTSTGLNQVMAEADAPKGSMYFHFPGGKAELAAAAIERFAGRIRGHLLERLATSGSVRDAVAGFFDSYVEHLEATQFAEGCAVATVALDGAAEHDVLADAAGGALRDWTGLLAQALEAEGRGEPEAHRMATLIIAAIEGTIVMARAERSTEPIVAARDALLAVLDPSG
jgi:TetR/AcrR family transcriptional regulator, lmrAB and yxaGH operons repressor